MKPRTANSSREASAKVALGTSFSMSSVTLEPMAVARVFRADAFDKSRSGSGSGMGHIPAPIAGYPG